MTEEEDEHNVTNDLEEGTSTVKSTPAKPILDETWSQVEELPDPDDSDYTDEEVGQTSLAFDSCVC